MKKLVFLVLLVFIGIFAWGNLNKYENYIKNFPEPIISYEFTYPSALPLEIKTFFSQNSVNINSKLDILIITTAKGKYYIYIFDDGFVLTTGPHN